MVAVCAPAASLIWFFSPAAAYADPSPHEPDSPKPAASEPKDSESKDSAPKAASAPKVAEPKTAEPQTNADKANFPKNVELKTAEPKPAEPKTNTPKTAEPKAADADAAEPKAADTKESSPALVESDSTDPIVTEPVAAAPQVEDTTVEPEVVVTSPVLPEPVVSEPTAEKADAPDPSLPVTAPGTLSANPVVSDPSESTPDVNPAVASGPDAVLGAPGLIADDSSTSRALPESAEAKTTSSLTGPALNEALSPAGSAPAAVPLNSPEGQATLEQFVPPGAGQGDSHVTAYVDGYAYGFDEDPDTGVITYSNNTDHVQAVITVKDGQPQIVVVSPGAYTEISGSQAIVLGPPDANGDQHLEAQLVLRGPQQTPTTVLLNDSRVPTIDTPPRAGATRVDLTTEYDGEGPPPDLAPFLPAPGGPIPRDPESAAFVDRYAFGFNQNSETGIVTYLNTSEHVQAVLVSTGPGGGEGYAILQPGQYTEVPYGAAVVVLAPIDSSGGQVIDVLFAPGPGGGTRTYDFSVDEGIPQPINYSTTPPVILPEPHTKLPRHKTGVVPRAGGAPPPNQRWGNANWYGAQQMFEFQQDLANNLLTGMDWVLEHSAPGGPKPWQQEFGKELGKGALAIDTANLLFNWTTSRTSDKVELGGQIIGGVLQLGGPVTALAGTAVQTTTYAISKAMETDWSADTARNTWDYAQGHLDVVGQEVAKAATQVVWDQGANVINGFMRGIPKPPKFELPKLW
jgi:hypothetical protein